MNNEKTDLFRLHPASRGLSDDGIREIAGATEVVRCAAGDWIHHANEFVTSLFLVVHGRLRVSIVDINGQITLQRWLESGSQFGGLSAAMNEPAPLDCVAVDPTTLLKLDYRRGLELLRKYPEFRHNVLQSVVESVKSAILRDRHLHKPLGVGFFHQSNATRTITQRLFQRLSDLGDAICVLTDETPPPATERVRYRRVIGGDSELDATEGRRQMPEWLREGRVMVDIQIENAPQRVAAAFESLDRVFLCVTPENWQASVAQLRAIFARSPSWRDKVFLVWLLAKGQIAPLAAELRVMVH